MNLPRLLFDFRGRIDRAPLLADLLIQAAFVVVTELLIVFYGFWRFDGRLRSSISRRRTSAR